MKKRLLSMLMAVLMIASLVPATALAADADTCNHVYQTVSIKADAETKTPGVTAQVCVKCGAVTATSGITGFAKKACAICKNEVTVELQKAACGVVGLTATFCGDCGNAIKGVNVFKGTAALVADYDFTVVEKPTCNTDGWGYAVCKVCGEPVFVANSTAVAEILAGTNASADDVKAETAKFAMTNKGHANEKLLVAITEDILAKDGKTVAYHAAKAATHTATINEKPVWVDKDGNYVDYQSPLAVKKVDGSGWYAALACGDCEYIKEVGPEAALNDAHSAAMTLVEAGKKPVKNELTGVTTDGKTDTYWCAICKKNIGGETLTYDSFYPTVAEEQLPALGTTRLVTADVKDASVGAVAAKAATCLEKGYTGDTETYIYDKTITNTDGTTVKVGKWVVTDPGEEIAALGHNYVARAAVAPTCSKEGKSYYGMYECDRDGCKATDEGHYKNDTYYYETTIPALGCKYETISLVEPTCQNTGLNVYKCTVCGLYMTKDDVVVSQPLNKVNHVAADELANVVEATCTEAGYTGDQVCKWCGETLKKGEEVAALGHTTEVKDAKDATCTEAGYTGDEVCTVCGETVKKGEEIAALGHKFENGVCTVCGAADPDYVVPNPFKDVEESSPYYDAIIWAANKGVTTGKTADTFGVNDGCTRAQIVTFLYRAAGSPEVAADTVNPFTDVSKDSVYYNAIMWAVEKGITKGTTETTFDPNAVCTRGQIVTFLFRASGDEKVATGVDFTDVAADSYCADAVAWAVANGVTKGVTATTFAPDATCTRGQAVTFIYRALAE